MLRPGLFHQNFLYDLQFSSPFDQIEMNTIGDSWRLGMKSTSYPYKTAWAVLHSSYPLLLYLSIKLTTIGLSLLDFDAYLLQHLILH